jgi:DNA-dependent RNA polymerase auxiliary subunit epsilon
MNLKRNIEREARETVGKKVKKKDGGWEVEFTREGKGADMAAEKGKRSFNILSYIPLGP